MTGLDVMKVVWIDVHRRPWHLHGPGAGAEGVILGSDPSGLIFPPHEILADEGARQDGATPRRSVTSKRELDFVVSIGNQVGLQITSFRHFQTVHDLWWRGWPTEPNKANPGHLCFFTKAKGWRIDPLYLDGAPEPTSGMNPARNLHESYLMSATAFGAFHQSLEREVSWTNSAGTNQGILKMRNDASQRSWPRYTLKGPGRWSIQDVDPHADPEADLRMLVTPVILAGETLRIDLHPRNRTARLYNPSGQYLRNVWAQMAGRRGLHPLEPYQTTDVVVRIENGDLTSEAVGTLTPLNASPL